MDFEEIYFDLSAKSYDCNIKSFDLILTSSLCTVYEMMA